MNDELKKFYKENSNRNRGSFDLSEEANQRVKANIIARLNSTVEVPKEDESFEQIPFWKKLQGALSPSYVIAPVVVLLFITGTTYASAQALPGDTLYGMRQQVEKARILITPTTEGKLKLRERFAEKHLEELQHSQNIQPSANKNNDKKVRTNVDINTNVDIDADNISSERKSEAHKNKSRQEADKAIEVLQQTRQNWENRGNKNKADEIERKVKFFKQGLEDRRH